jgi:hypothetical protein
MVRGWSGPPQIQSKPITSKTNSKWMSGSSPPDPNRKRKRQRKRKPAMTGIKTRWRKDGENMRIFIKSFRC